MASESAVAKDEGVPQSNDAASEKPSTEQNDTQNGSNGLATGETTEESTAKDERPKQSSDKATAEEPDSRDWKARRERDQKLDDERKSEKRYRDAKKLDRRPEHYKRPKVDYSKNVKSKFEDLPESNDHDEIRKQVEFYFSDSNLPSDKFLFSKVGGSANNAVPISVIHSFKRMRHFQPFSAIVEALQASTTLDVVDNDTAIRRKTPLPSTLGSTSFTDNITLLEDAARPRSIYAKGFGAEGPSTQFDIEAFFAPYGPTNAIRLRRTTEKIFKGSVFVEFDSAETQAAFLALDPKPRWEGRDLQIMSKEAYDKAKAEDFPESRTRKDGHHGSHNGYRGRGGRGGRGRGRGGYHEHRERRTTSSKSEDDASQSTAKPTVSAAANEDDGNQTASQTATATGKAADDEINVPESKKRPAPSEKADDAEGRDEAPPVVKKAKTTASNEAAEGTVAKETVADAFAAAEQAGKVEAKLEAEASGA